MTVAARDLVTVARFDARLFWRDRTALSTSVTLFLLLGVGLPVMADRLQPGHPEAVVAQHLGILSMLLVLATFGQVVNTLTTRRDQLLLKRLRATGMADRDILGGGVLNLVLQNTLLAAVVSVALYALTSLPVPRDPLLLLVAVVAGAAVLCLLGTAFTPLVPRPEVGAVMTMPFFLLAGVGAGGFGPLTEMLPGWVSTLLGLLPTDAVADIARIAYAADGTFGGDLAAAAGPALKLAAWAAIGLFAVSRWFRWDPRRQ
ncbi:ABC transporter permease [Streptosporangium sandarakinum]|uniref:ABC-2 type transport system permease protein n=1 Tax=Streptosporangium sandarakinum TaxID=1260955 RepID=A0A852UTX5_9ACTN|nr:ABC transporter permease [Streptosporangium sandarakinum]NYF38936.1 ABC-2 type transport system permease protein [Streptosporangium sandarakinum]